MASDTVPAAPGQGAPDGTTGPDATGIPGAPARPASGWLADALAPVEPARPAPGFHLNPTLGGPDATLPNPQGIHLDGGASSADYHDTGKNTTTGQQQGIWRAWLLAGAERWRKGADARNKMLDIQKAKAQAFKEARTTTVNRSEKTVGGGTSTGSNTNSGKSSSNKTSGGSQGNGGPGRGGASGAGGSSGRSAGAGAGHGAGGGRHQTGNKNAPGGKDWKSNGPHKASHHSDSGKGSHVEHKTARETPPERTRKSNTAPGPVTKTDKTTSSKTIGGSSGTGNGGGTGNAPKPTTPKQQQPKQQTDTCGTASGIDLAKNNKNNKNKDAKDAAAAGGKTPGTGAAPTPPGGGSKSADPSKKNPDLKGGTKPGGTTPALPTIKTVPGTGRAVGPSVDTQTSRETGYRDGTRIGKAEAHVKAYKDGVRDGRTDMRQAAALDKARLDKARDARKQPAPGPATTPKPVPPRPPHPPKPTSSPPVPASPKTAPPTQPSPATTPPPSSAPAPQADGAQNATPPKDQPVTTPTTTEPVAPVAVSNVTASHVILGNGKVRTRGEIRTLKGYERLIEDKGDAMNHVAELAKALQSHAEEQNKKATNKLDQARGKKGIGADVIKALTTLQEQTALQSRQAGELHKRAVRATEATHVLLTNVSTRYGEIYKAVVNSPLTAPAELDFYNDRNTHE